MTVQFWLWGLDAAHGDLTARGFEKAPRPANTESSVYRCDGLHLHGFGLWLENHPKLPGELLVYRRPQKTWYALPANAVVSIEHFSKGDRTWCDFCRPRIVPHKQALELMHSVITDYEAWLVTQRGSAWRAAQLQHIPSRAVRRARRAWRGWVGVSTSAKP